MADIASSPDTAPRGGHGTLTGGSDRLRRRRRAETRLKLYGITALTIAAGALVALLGSVVFQATGALTATYLTYEIELDTDTLGVTASSDPSDIRQAEFATLIDQSLEARFPLATGRDERRALHDLVSDGASYELSRHVSESPDLLGGTVTFPLIASDTAGIYMQERDESLGTRPVDGRLTVTEGPDGTVEIASTADDFVAGLRAAKAQLVDDAARLREQAARQDNAVRVYGERAEAAETEEERAENLESQAEVRARRDELLAQAEALEARAEAPGGTEAVGDETRSLLIEAGGGWIRMTEVSPDGGRGEMLTRVDLPVEGSDDWAFHVTAQAESDRNYGDHQIAWLEELRAAGIAEQVFNTRFFTAADSRAPELAGIWGAVVGSFWTMVVTFVLAFPTGVLGAIYLEEFAPKNRFTNFIEVNINNLAAVPSIVFGLLGLAVFLGFFGVPRSAPLAGGIVLALMSLPTMIIAARAAIRAVPPSIRDAALGVGASKTQASFHHVLPLAMPGILTGTIIAMAQALGETAPLIMIGMVAFIVEVPSGITDSATALPVQVFRWSDFPEQAFEAKTAAAICVLLVFLVSMNALAIFLRKRFERRW